jgi:hypothetical protein
MRQRFACRTEHQRAAGSHTFEAGTDTAWTEKKLAAEIWTLQVEQQHATALRRQYDREAAAALDISVSSADIGTAGVAYSCMYCYQLNTCKQHQACTSCTRIPPFYYFTVMPG